MNEIFERVSIRRFTEQKVEDEKVELFLRAAMQAPSGGNQHSEQFIVVRNTELIRKLREAARPYGALESATLAIVTLADQEKMKFEELWRHDLGAVCENILLEATSLGLGAVWMSADGTRDRQDKIRKLFDIPDNLLPFSVIALGYPAEEKKAISRYDESRVQYFD